MPRKFLPLLFVLMGMALAACSSSDEEKSPAPAQVERISVAATPISTSTRGITILWQFTLTDGWHLYSTQRNDSGFPPTIKLTLPDGWVAGPLQWPVPARHIVAGDILDHVYYDELLLLQDLTVPAAADSGEVFTIPARLDWLICKDACVPGHKELDLEVTVGEMAIAKTVSDQVARARAALPVPAPQVGFGLTWHDAAVEIVVPGAVALAFYPAEDCALLTDVIKDAVGNSDRLELNFRAKDGQMGPLKGILHQKLTGGRHRNWIITQPFGG